MPDYDTWLLRLADEHMENSQGQDDNDENEDLGYIEYDSEYMSDMWFGKH